MTSTHEDERFPHEPHHCGGGLDAYVSSDSKSIKLMDLQGHEIIMDMDEAIKVRDALTCSPMEGTDKTDLKHLGESVRHGLLDWLLSVYPPNAPIRV